MLVKVDKKPRSVIVLEALAAIVVAGTATTTGLAAATTATAAWAEKTMENTLVL